MYWDNSPRNSHLSWRWHIPLVSWLSCMFQSSAIIMWPNLYHDVTYGTAITVAESESDFRIATDTPYLALTGELWVVYCENFGDNWPRYNDTILFSRLPQSTVQLSIPTRSTCRRCSQSYLNITSQTRRIAVPYITLLLVRELDHSSSCSASRLSTHPFMLTHWSLGDQGPFSMFLLRAYSAELVHEQKQSSLWASSARSFSIYRSGSLLMISKLINTWWSGLFWNWS